MHVLVPMWINYFYNLITSSVCVLPCPLGYGPNSACTGCVPVHICVTDNPCENGGTCNIGTNNNTDYTCSCAPNFSGTNCTSKLTLDSLLDVRLTVALHCLASIRKWHNASIRKWCSTINAKIDRNWVYTILASLGARINHNTARTSLLCPYCKLGLIQTDDDLIMYHDYCYI